MDQQSKTLLCWNKSNHSSRKLQLPRIALEAASKTTTNLEENCCNHGENEIHVQIYDLVYAAAGANILGGVGAFRFSVLLQKPRDGLTARQTRLHPRNLTARTQYRSAVQPFEQHGCCFFSVTVSDWENDPSNILAASCCSFSWVTLRGTS